MHKPTILVVDDDGPILVLMRSVLREFGFETVTAASGEEAIAAAREARPGLVLLDRHMPGMNGDEVIRALRASDGSHMPILMLSGEPLTRRELAALGADGAITKPFDVVELVKQIRTYLAPAAASE